MPLSVVTTLRRCDCCQATIASVKLDLSSPPPSLVFSPSAGVRPLVFWLLRRQLLQLLLLLTRLCALHPDVRSSRRCLWKKATSLQLLVPLWRIYLPVFRSFIPFSWPQAIGVCCFCVARCPAHRRLVRGRARVRRRQSSSLRILAGELSSSLLSCVVLSKEVPSSVKRCPSSPQIRPFSSSARSVFRPRRRRRWLAAPVPARLG